MMFCIKNNGTGTGTGHVVTILLVIGICKFVEISSSPLPQMDNKLLLSEEMKEQEVRGASRHKRFLPFFYYYDEGFKNDNGHESTRDYSKSAINAIQMTSDKRGIIMNNMKMNKRNEIAIPMPLDGREGMGVGVGVEEEASQVYYITLPSSPYMYIPDYSRYNNIIANNAAPVPLPYDINGPININSPFINLPIPFISNGKPSAIFTYPHPKHHYQHHETMKPNKVNNKVKPTAKPDSQMYHLNKGPYTFNGKPSDIYLLQDSLNSIYSDAISNFYP